MLNAPPPAPLPPAPLHYLVFDYLKGEPRLRRHTPPFVTQDGLGWIDAPGVPATLRLVALPPSSPTGGPTAGVMRIRGRGVSGDASCCGGVTAGKDGGLCARIGSFAVVMASGLVVVLMLRGMNVPLIGASDVVRDNLRTLIRASDDIATHRLLGRSATHTGEAPSTIALAPQFEFDFQDKGAYTSSEVAPCRPEVRYLQVYHLSKCGGTNFRQVLRAALNVTDIAEAAGEKIGHGWWFEDHGVMRRERENYPDPRYKRDPASPAKREAFIIGLIRNPFGYYRSFYSMLLR